LVVRAGDEKVDGAALPRHGTRLREHTAAERQCSTHVGKNLISDIIIIVVVVVVVTADNGVEATSSSQQAKFVLLRALAEC